MSMRLSKRDLPNAVRTPTAGGRFSSILTEAGREKAAEMPPLIRQVNELYLADMTKDERAQVIALLQKAVAKSKAVGKP